MSASSFQGCTTFLLPLLLHTHEDPRAGEREALSQLSINTSVEQQTVQPWGKQNFLVPSGLWKGTSKYNILVEQ